MLKMQDLYYDKFTVGSIFLSLISSEALLHIGMPEMAMADR